MQPARQLLEALKLLRMLISYIRQWRLRGKIVQSRLTTIMLHLQQKVLGHPTNQRKGALTPPYQAL